MNYIAIAEGEGALGVVVVQEALRASNPLRPSGFLDRYFEATWAETVPSLETLQLLSALRKIVAIPEIGTRYELLADLSARGEVLARDLRDEGFYPVPIIIAKGITSIYGADGIWRVVRQEIVAALSSLIQSGRIGIAEKIPSAEALGSQVEEFRAKPMRDSADSPKPDEQLALALGLIAWRIYSLHELDAVDPMGTPPQEPFNPAKAGLTD